MRSLIAALMMLNWFAAPIAVIWLIIRGEWWAIGTAIMSLFSPFVLGIALLPGVALGIPALAAAERRSPLALVLGALPLLYTAALICVWCIGVLLFLLRRADASTVVPLTLLAYSIATAPWGYMATKETQGGGGEGSMVAVFFAQIGMAIVALFVLLARPRSPTPLWWIMGSVMVVEVIVSLVAAKMMMVAQKQADHLEPGSFPP